MNKHHADLPHAAKGTQPQATRASHKPARVAAAPRVRQMNGFDSLLLNLDSAFAYAQGGFLQIYEPFPGDTPTQRFERLRRHFARCIAKTPSFRRAIVTSMLPLDHGWFVEDMPVDLDFHLRQHALPAPGNLAQLNRLLATICIQPMDLDRPPWEIHVIDNVNVVKGGFALILKVHHAVADGSTVAEMLSAMHSTTSKRSAGKALRPPAVARPPLPPVSRAAWRSVVAYARLGAAVTGAVVEQLTKRVRSSGSYTHDERATEASRKPSLHVPRCILNAEVSRRRDYAYASFDLGQIDRIRALVPGATINDVYLAVVGATLRDYLRARRQLPTESLVAAVSVSVRNADERGSGGNHVAVLRLPYHTDIADPLQRLRLIAAESARAKAPLRGSGGRKSANWLKMLPAPLSWLIGTAVGHAKLSARLPPFFNVMATNVPGPREPLYLDGARLIDLTGIPPLFHGIGVIFNATNYCRSLQVSVHACRDTVPDIAQLESGMRGAFDALLKHAARGTRSRSKS